MNMLFSGFIVFLVFSKFCLAKTSEINAIDLEKVYTANNELDAIEAYTKALQLRESDEDILWRNVDKQKSDKTVKIMQHLHKNGETKNKSFVMASLPLFIEMAMVCIGASGNTLQQCIDFLGPSPSRDVLNAIYHLTIKYQLDQNNSAYTLKVLNKIYVDEQKFKLNQNGKSTFEKVFNSQIQIARFETPEDKKITATAINKEAETQCNMKQLVIESELENTVMMLISAMRFAGKWVTKFPKVNNQNFFDSTGTKVLSQVPMMSGVKAHLHYKGTEDFQMVGIPYQDGNKNDSLHFVLYLPKKGKTISQVLNKLSSDGTLVSTFSDSGKTEVEVTMPWFELDSKIQFEDALKELGFVDGFSLKKANFSDFSKTATYISSWWQNVFIKVDQNGTTGGTKDETAGNKRGFSRKPEEVNANRPFIFMVVDGYENVLLNGLYMGDSVPAKIKSGDKQKAKSDSLAAKKG